VSAILTWYQSLAERERRFVLFGALAGTLLLVFAMLLPLDRSVSRAQERLARKHEDLVEMRRIAPELAAAGPALAAPTAQGSLIRIVDNAAREAGLGSALVSSEPAGKDGLRVRLDKAPFDTLVAWLARLAQQHGIGVESATIDTAGAPGIVNAGIVLHTRQ